MSTLDLGLGGRVAWVTGAGRGIGRAIALGLAGAGAHVALTARTESELVSVANDVPIGLAHPLVLPGSVDSEEQVGAIVDRIVAEFGSIDVLIHCAGISPLFKRAEDVELAAWNEVLTTNLTGTFICCREVGKRMLAVGKGSIVNVTSVHGTVGMGRLAPYAASKGGMEMLTRVLALEWADRGIRVNALAPGYFLTALSAPMIESAWQSRLISDIPLGRIGRIDELVGAALFLASDLSSYMTGTTLFVDGGWTSQ